VRGIIVLRSTLQPIHNSGWMIGRAEAFVRCDAWARQA
jgi:hypothetical protein